jgi:hypothetical protein
MKPYFLIKAAVPGENHSIIHYMSCDEHLPLEVKHLIHGGWEVLIIQKAYHEYPEPECFECYAEGK